MPDTGSAPTDHTYTLSLEPDPKAPHGYYVVIKDVDKFWAKVVENHQVQFIPDPDNSMLAGATIKINFVPDNTQGPLPLMNPCVTTTDFQLVVNPTREFKAECYLILATGTEIGYDGVDGGGRPCTGIGC